MKKAEMKAFKEQLLVLRARLRGDVSAMADAALRKTRVQNGFAIGLLVFVGLVAALVALTVVTLTLGPFGFGVFVIAMGVGALFVLSALIARKSR